MLCERYPELHFRLMWEGLESPFEQEGDNAFRLLDQDRQWLHAEDGIEAELSRFSKDLHLDKTDVFYLYGLGLGHHFSLLEKWLSESPRRKLVLLEDDLAAVDACVRFGNGEIFSHPQVHLRFVPHSRAWHSALRECAKEFPTTRIEMRVLESYAKEKKKKRLASLRLKLFRLSGLVDTYFSEAIHSHIIHKNLFDNLKHLTTAFDACGLRGSFKGVPAILCGAGPSLKTSIGTLKTLQDSALIMAGGSTITALGNLGVTPHLALAIDPNAEELHRLQASVVQEVPFIYGHRLHPKVFNTFNAPLGFAPTNTAGVAEGWIQKELHLGESTIGEELGPEALSITTLGLAIAYAMGCDPIVMVGVDLAYTGLERYAPGIMEQQKIDPKTMVIPREQLETMLKRKDAKGQAIYTLVKWVMEADVFSRFAKKHRDVTFLRCGDGGLPMKGIPSMTIEEIASQYCTKTIDLLGKLHQVVETSKLPEVTEDKIDALKLQLQESLKRIVGICQEIIEEITRAKTQEDLPLFPTGKMMGLEMAFEEELAFSCLFETVGFAFSERLRNEKNLPAESIEIAQEKWRHLLNVAQYYLSRPEFSNRPLA